MLRALRGDMGVPWRVIEDFNDILIAGKKNGACGRAPYGCYRDFVKLSITVD